MDIHESELQDLYSWVDEIPLSRPKRNIARDFSDGVLMAEIVQHFFPKLVELHNYSSANASTQKMYNWNTLNNKVFKRLGFTLSKPEFESAANCQPGAIERILKLTKIRIAKCREEGFTGAASPTMVPAATATAVVTANVRGGVPVMNIMAAPDHHQQGYGMAAAPQQKELSQYAAAPPARPQPGMGQQHAGMMAPKGSKGMGGVPVEVLADREQIIGELRETNEILETKVRKLEQLVRLKDAKISTLMAKLQSANLA